MFAAACLIIIAINQLSIFMLVRELRKSAALRDKRLDLINSQMDVHFVEMKVFLEAMQAHDAVYSGEWGYRALTSRRRALRCKHTPGHDMVPAGHLTPTKGEEGR